MKYIRSHGFNKEQLIALKALGFKLGKASTSPDFLERKFQNCWDYIQVEEDGQFWWGISAFRDEAEIKSKRFKTFQEMLDFFVNEHKPRKFEISYSGDGCGVYKFKSNDYYDPQRFLEKASDLLEIVIDTQWNLEKESK